MNVGDSPGILLWKDALRMVCLGLPFKAGLKEVYRGDAFSSIKDISWKSGDLE